MGAAGVVPRGGGRPELPSRERALIDTAFTRATGAPLVAGNAVRLLRDAAENYPAWLDAIRSAERTVYFESYIIHEDAAGAEFAAVLAAKAREGVRVRIAYDWLGGLGKTSGAFWRALRRAGADVRCFNPPRFTNPAASLHRDHRKMLSVDGRVAFVTGLCVGRMWTGDPARGIAPWRDTGVELRGPAVADVEQAFARIWKSMGPPLPDGERRPREDMPEVGDVLLRVVASEPWTAGMLRLDQLIASAARETLWLTDAYFAGMPSYVQALRAAARDGVDVRLLVPGGSDIPILRPLSQAGYRPLLEAGIRVFEWKGPMLHAKTAVADSRWARVGSSNLNLASWLGNYELDVAIENARFAAEMQRQYLTDLENASEIVLTAERRRSPRGRRSPTRRPTAARAGGSAGRAAAGALRI
ncbi:MAG TPA: phospholipase D-like domain-containing protein, partial [Longimicrobium sp.]|nr:phospholipase D-like domain-containing protein [Longimicrobium sp.]